jgi:hypothetical protein
MLIEAIKHPIRYALRDGREVRLVPGKPIDLPEPQATALLAKAPDRVRAVGDQCASSMTIEPASPTARETYWETADGRILGPVVPEYLAQDGDEFWIVTTYQGECYWIRENRLRTRRAFQQQPIRPNSGPSPRIPN